MFVHSKMPDQGELFQIDLWIFVPQQWRKLFSLLDEHILPKVVLLAVVVQVPRISCRFGFMRASKAWFAGRMDGGHQNKGHTVTDGQLKTTKHEAHKGWCKKLVWG